MRKTERRKGRRGKNVGTYKRQREDRGKDRGEQNIHEMNEAKTVISDYLTSDIFMAEGFMGAVCITGSLTVFSPHFRFQILPASPDRSHHVHIEDRL